MDTRELLRELKEERNRKHPPTVSQDKTISIIETKIFLKKLFDLLNGTDMLSTASKDEKSVLPPQQLIQGVRAALAQANLQNLYVFRRPIQDVVMKNEIEDFSYMAWVQQGDIIPYERYLISFLVKLFIFQKKIPKEKFDRMLFFAACCLHKQCVEWANKQGSWEKAFLESRKERAAKIVSESEQTSHSKRESALFDSVLTLVVGVLMAAGCYTIGKVFFGGAEGAQSGVTLKPKL